MKIKKKQVIQIHAVLDGGNTPYFGKQSLEKMFPKAFKENKEKQK